jgi:hypothetical protein
MTRGEYIPGGRCRGVIGGGWLGPLVMLFLGALVIVGIVLLVRR